MLISFLPLFPPDAYAGLMSSLHTMRTSCDLELLEWSHTQVLAAGLASWGRGAKQTGVGFQGHSRLHFPHLQHGGCLAGYFYKGCVEWNCIKSIPQVNSIFK